VFILECCFTTTCLAAVCEVCHHVHPNNEVPNETTIFRLVEESGEAGAVYFLTHPNT
jgi:hypothetical protein